jgi:hypothetical protein
MDVAFKWYLKEDPCSPAVIDKWLSHPAGREGPLPLWPVTRTRIVAHASLAAAPLRSQESILEGFVSSLCLSSATSSLGTWMIFDLTKRAMEMQLERIRIDFVVGIDDYAIKAVQKLDFVKEGLLRDYIQDPRWKIPRLSDYGQSSCIKAGAISNGQYPHGASQSKMHPTAKPARARLRFVRSASPAKISLRSRCRTPSLTIARYSPIISHKRRAWSQPQLPGRMPT